MKKINFKIFCVSLIFLFSGIETKKLFALQNGMSVDLSFDYGLDIVKSDSFKIKMIPPIPIPVGGNTPQFNQFNFDQKLDYFYGGNILFGYMMENGVSASLGVGYHQSKIDHKDNTKSNLKPTIFSGMINIDYYFDMGLILYPFLGFGAGIGRIDLKGLANQADAANDLTLEFKNLKKNKFMYQASAGLLVKNFGIAYKFLGMMDLEDSDTFTDLKVNLIDNANNLNYELNQDLFKFDTFENKNHIVTAFMKFVI